MSESPTPRRIGRSIGAVIAGILVGAVFSLGTDAVLHVAGVFPPWGQSMAGYEGALLLATAYRTIYGLAGAYVTAWLAPDRPMRHAVILGSLGLIASIAGAAGTWNKGPAFGPHWYPLALIILAVPTAWTGGKLRTAQIRSRVAS